jgi:hypothetical protein
MFHALKFNTPPFYYYRYRLFDPRNSRRAGGYLYDDQMSVLHPVLAIQLPSDAPLRRKDLFYAEGKRHGLPVVDVVAVFGAGEMQNWYAGTPGRLPALDLVLKPVDDACGHGFQRWTYNTNRHTWRRGEQELDCEGLLAHGRRCSELRWHVLQERVTNHRAMSGLCSQGLSTIRVVTYRRLSGESGALLAVLRMPTGASPVDNFEAGGIAAPIDLQTGKLGIAVAKDPSRGTFTHHPDSQACIEGYAVPFFSEAIDVALSAHACFPWVPSVGWDVVITDAGPRLLEANPNWCVEIAQIVTGTPLGETIYPEVYLEYLAAQGGEKSRGHCESLAETVETGSTV